jgi:hypothetical protein
VHAAAWAARAEGAEEGAPACADCHDPHGGRSAEEAALACGRCHEEVRAAFDEGPHREAFARRGFLDCIECHGAHEIFPADASLVTAGREAACRRCHGRGEEVYERIGVLGEALEDADAARRRIANGDEASRARAEEVAASLVTAVHRLAVDDVEAQAARLVEISAEVPEEPPEEERGVSRYWVLAGVAVLIGVAFTFTMRRRKS